MDSNSFTLTCSSLVGLTYLDDSFVVTAGQKATPPPTFKRNGDTWTVSIGADRKGSPAVANSFNGRTGGALHNYTNSSGDKNPQELNFYFGVVGTFEAGGSEPIRATFYLGQGHYTFNNNWWLGGNSVLYAGGDPLFNLISGGAIVATFKISGSGNAAMTLSPD